MKHPILLDDNKELRSKVLVLLKDSFYVPRTSNIVFVCGGNDSCHLRLKFHEFCKLNNPEYRILFPEFAIPSLMDIGLSEPFDIADFEELISEIAHSTIVFPEAPGSYAETGYFSANKKISKSTLLVLDISYQATDSFISLGPAKKIAGESIFQPMLQLNYRSPNFSEVVQRIARKPLKVYRKHLNVTTFSNMAKFDLFCLIYCIVDILRIATKDDIVFILRGLFGTSLVEKKTQQIISILYGCDYLQQIGKYGHFRTTYNSEPLVDIQVGKKTTLIDIRYKLLEIFELQPSDFQKIIDELSHAS